MRPLPALLLAAASPAFAALRIPNAPSSSYTRAPANSTPSKLLAKLYVSSYDGNITTFHLGTTSNKPTEIYFTSKSKNTDCGAQPTWMNLDHKNKALYCINEQWNPDAGNATYNKLSADKDGKLTLDKSVNTTYGGPVHAVYMPTTKCGSEGYHVIAHYSPGGISVLDNKLSHVSEKNLTIGPFDPKGLPNQQGSHAHQAILDPKGSTVFIPDLGQDKIFMADVKNNKYDSFDVPARTGPRHGCFAPLPGYGNRVGFYVIGEISNKIEGYELTYTTDGKPKLSEEGIASQSALHAEHKEGYAAGELALTPDRRFLIASNRNNSLSTVEVCDDASYKSCKTEKADTLVTFKPAANGTLEHVQTWSAGGMLPRSFSLNAKGDMIAVGLVSRVVVMQRDVKTGMIGDVVAEGMFEGEMAVTNVVWDEEEKVEGGWFYGGQSNVY